MPSLSHRLTRSQRRTPHPSTPIFASAHTGPGGHTTLGFLPTGYAHGDAGGTFTTTLYYNMRHDEFGSWLEGGLDKWKRRCAELMPEADPLLASLTSMKQLAFAQYSDGTMWRFHSGGRVVCIGDVSHSMSPQASAINVPSQCSNRSLWDCSLG